MKPTEERPQGLALRSGRTEGEGEQPAAGTMAVEHAGEKLCGPFFLPLVIAACHHYRRRAFVPALGSCFVRGRNGLSSPLPPGTCREAEVVFFCHSKTDTSWGEQLPKSWWHVRQVLKKGFGNSQAQVCATGRSWTTTTPALPTPSHSFPVGTFFVQWEAGAKVAGYLLPGRQNSVSVSRGNTTP